MRKYILEREDKIYLPDREKEQPKNRIFREKRTETERREREMKIPSACGPWFFALSDGKKIVFRVFIFFLKASLLNSFFDEKHKKTSSREEKRRNIKSDSSCVFYYILKRDVLEQFEQQREDDDDDERWWWWWSLVSRFSREQS